MAISANGRRLNRRGEATRHRVLAVAIRCLADGGPEAVSANLVAREAGVTWGTVQHQFGDADGLWAAVIRSVSDGLAEAFPFTSDGSTTLEGRVTTIVDLLWAGFDSTPARALLNLRQALPLGATDLADEHPRSAEALADLDDRWSEVLDRSFAGFSSSPDKLVGVRTLLPSAVRGLYLDSRMSTSEHHIAEGRDCLIRAVCAHLS